MQPVAFSRPCMGPEEEQAVAEVLRSGWIVAGPRVAELESVFATRCNTKFAVATSSWTTAAFLVLKTWGIGPGDEVVVPSLTFIGTVNAVRHTGATPVFADIDPQTWNISPSSVEQVMTSRTRVILPVDQLGMPADLVTLSELCKQTGVRLLDDAACALGSKLMGAPVGQFGDAAIFSLHARKVITAGEGGVVVTNDRELATRLKRLRHQGMSKSDYARHTASPVDVESYNEIGYNFRLTDIQAAIALVQLSRLDDFIARRTALADRYGKALKDNRLVEPPFVPASATPNWQSYQVLLRRDAAMGRNALMEALHDKGISVRRGVMASHLEPACADIRRSLPVTERIAACTLQLPLYPDLTFEDQDRVISALQDLSGIPADNAKTSRSG